MKILENKIREKQLFGRIWCALFFIALIGFSVERWHLGKTIGEGYKFLVIDPNTFYLPRKLDFRDAHQLHYEQAQLACETLLNRNPNGIDAEKRMKALFHPDAYKTAMESIESEAMLFKGKSMHQKTHIEATELLKMSDSSVLIMVSGQLIRVGNFKGEPFVETLDFQFRSHFILNTHMLENGRYPTLVYDYNLKTIPTSGI